MNDPKIPTPIPLEAAGQLLPSVLSIVEDTTPESVAAVVQAVVSQCQETLANLNTDARTYFASCIQACEVSRENCEACVAARVAGGIDRFNALVAKCQGPVGQAIATQFAAVVDKLAALGVRLPTPEQIGLVAQGVPAAVAIATPTAEAADYLAAATSRTEAVGGAAPSGGTITGGPTGGCTQFCECQAGDVGVFDSNGCCIGCGRPTNPLCVPPNIIDPATGVCGPQPPPPPPPPPPPGGGGGPGGGPGPGGPGGGPGPGPGGPPPPPPPPTGGTCQARGKPIIVGGKCCWPRVPPTLIGPVKQIGSAPVTKLWYVAKTSGPVCDDVVVYCGDDPPKLDPGQVILSSGDWVGDIDPTYAFIDIPVCDQKATQGGNCPSPCDGSDLTNTGCALLSPTGVNDGTLWVTYSQSQAPYDASDPANAGCSVPGQIVPLNQCYVDQIISAGGVVPQGAMTGTLRLKDVPAGWPLPDLKSCPVPPPPPPPPPSPKECSEGSNGNGSVYCDPAELVKVWTSPANAGVLSSTLGSDIVSSVLDCSQISTLNPLKYVCDLLVGIGGSAVDSMVPILSTLSCSTSPNYLRAVITGAAYGFIGQYTAAIPRALRVQNEYEQNVACQYLIPGAAEAASLNVHGWIDSCQFEALTAANGHCLPWARIQRDSQYRYPTIDESINLWRRQIITDDELHAFQKRNGVKDDETADRYRQLTTWIPPAELTARWNQTGIDDDQSAESLGLNDGLDDWLTDTGTFVARIHGQTDDDARRLYRQSWGLPSLVQAFEAYQRITEPQTLPGLDANVTPPSTDEMAAIVENAGIPPKWAARLAWLTYSPISIRHLRLLYESGVYDEKELARRYQALRYSPDDAKSLAHAIVVTTDQQKAKLEGQLQAPEILKLYQDDGLHQDEAIDLLRQSGVQEQAIIPLLTGAEYRRTALARSAKLKAMKRRWLMGQYDYATAVAKLIKWGYDSDRATTIIGDWQEELEIRHKEPAAAQLCEWYTRGYIDVSTYMQRLQNLGFSYADSVNIASACDVKEREKRVKEAVAAAKQAKAAAEKAERERIKALPYRQPPKPYLPARRKVSRVESTVKDVSKGTTKHSVTDSVDVSTGENSEKNSQETIDRG